MSYTAITKSILTSTQPKKRSGREIDCRYTYAKSPPVTSSIMSNRSGIFPLQLWQHPLSITYESSGTSSYHESVCPHDIQRDLPLIDLPVWKREVTTSKKLPMMQPSMKEIVMPNCQGMSSMCASIVALEVQKRAPKWSSFLHNYVCRLWTTSCCCDVRSICSDL